MRRTTRLAVLASAISVQLSGLFSPALATTAAYPTLTYITGSTGVRGAGGGQPPRVPVAAPAQPTNRVSLKRQDADVFLVGNVVRKNVNKKWLDVM